MFNKVFALNIDCVIEAVLTGTHNLCFRAKMRKFYNVYHSTPQFYYILIDFSNAYSKYFTIEKI